MRGILSHKIETFKQLSTKIKKKFLLGIQKFSSEERGQIADRNFTPEALIEKFELNNRKCFLTGRPIDLEIGKSYHLDHLVARSRGGKNTLENCNIVCKEANIAKSNLTLEEFQQLCLDVVNHFKLK